MHTSNDHGRKIRLWGPAIIVISGTAFCVFDRLSSDTDGASDNAVAAATKESPSSDAARNPAAQVPTGRHPTAKKAAAQKAPLTGGLEQRAAKGQAAEPSPEAFMDRLRQGMWISDPETALKLAGEGERRFEGTDLAAECAWVMVRSLVELGDHEEGRAKSKQMVEKYPGSRWTMDVVRHMLSHPPGE